MSGENSMSRPRSKRHTGVPSDRRDRKDAEAMDRALREPGRNEKHREASFEHRTRPTTIAPIRVPDLGWRPSGHAVLVILKLEERIGIGAENRGQMCNLMRI